MSFSVSQPSYLYQTPSGYIFRLRVPGDLRELVGRCEFRYSLRAGALRIARYRARLLASYVHQLFSRIRNSMTGLTPERITKMVKEFIRKELGDDNACAEQTALSTPGSIIVDGKTVLEAASMKGSNGVTLLSPEKIGQLVTEYTRETLANDEKCRAIGGTISTEPATLPGKSILEGSNMGADEAKSLLKSVTRWLQLPDHSIMHTITEKILTAQGVAIDPLSETYKTLSRELMKAFQSVLAVRTKRANGDYSLPDEDLVPSLRRQIQATSISRPVVAVKEEVPSEIVKFTDVQKRYFEEMVKGGSWTPKTEDTRRASLELFVQAMGDQDITKIDRKMMSEFKAILMKLPPNMNKSPLYRGKSIQEVLTMKPEKTLAVHSINKYTITLSGLFHFAVKNGFMVSNPASDMQIKNSKRADQEREPYTTKDLQKLFNSPEYQDRKGQSYTYWTPLIALYTGCRLNEICQLHLDDIRQEGGVWIFDINGRGEKQLKNMASERLIPVHPKLITAGLIEHVETLRVKGETRLFPELRLRRDGYGQTVSKWFVRFKGRCGVENSFHSFRHTFITDLKHKQVEPYMIKELAGHSIEGETMGRYGKRYTPEILLREAIEKIDYVVDVTSA